MHEAFFLKPATPTFATGGLPSDLLFLFCVVYYQVQAAVLVGQAKLVAICLMQAVAKRRVEDQPRSSLSPAGAAASSSAPHSPPTHQGFQPKALRVHTVTFNMAKQNPQELPEKLVGRAGCPAGLKKYDVVAVGTQESGNLQVSVHSRIYRWCAVSQ